MQTTTTETITEATAVTNLYDMTDITATPTDNKASLRILTKSLYDLQKLRISTGNRIAMNFRTKLGQDPSKPLEDADSKKVLKLIMAQWQRLTDGVVDMTRKQVKEVIKREKGVIDNEVEFRLIQSYAYLLKQEEDGFKMLGGILEEFPIYNCFLKGVKGIGPAMAAVIISELDPHRARHVSSFWKYAGLDCAEDGKGRSRKAEHLVEKTYINREGEEAVKRGITFNPFLKTKLVGVLGSSFLRSKSPYADVYAGYKHRLENHPGHVDKTLLHRHNMAIRYMVKMFLQDLWLNWRAVEGLEVSEPYAVAKLGMNPHGQERKTS